MSQLRTVKQIPPSRVFIGDRIRTDMGELGELAESMRARGQLQPIVITSSRQLVLGERRLRAAKMNGAPVDALVAKDAQDALDLLDAEAAENLCRKPWTKLEQYRYAKRRLDLEQQAAADRKAAGRRRGGKAKRVASGAAAPDAKKGDEGGRAVTRAAQAAGLGSRREFERIDKVCQAAAAEPDKYGGLVDELEKGAKPSTIAAKLERLEEGCDDDSYCTPEWIPEGIRKVEGRGIDLDPCTNANAIELGFVAAETNWTIEVDALAQSTWSVAGPGTLVFVNPPYSDPSPIIERLVEEWDRLGLDNVYVLVKLDTSTSWWRLLRDRSAFVVEPNKRLAHYVGKRPKKGSDFCSAMHVLCSAKVSNAEGVDLVDLYRRLIEEFGDRADVRPTRWALELMLELLDTKKAKRQKRG